MSFQKEIPSIAIVGRPNVGKSTIFNRLTHSRAALVHDQPGVTRDRKYGMVDTCGLRFMLIDTGGLETVETSVVLGHTRNLGHGISHGIPNLTEMIREQVAVAISECDLILFTVDARAGLLPEDEEIARSLRVLGKPILLVLNKVDGQRQDDLIADFYALGMESVVGISAEHARGIGKLLDHIEEMLPSTIYHEPEQAEVSDGDEGEEEDGYGNWGEGEDEGEEDEVADQVEDKEGEAETEEEDGRLRTDFADDEDLEFDYMDGDEGEGEGEDEDADDSGDEGEYQYIADDGTMVDAFGNHPASKGTRGSKDRRSQGFSEGKDQLPPTPKKKAGPTAVAIVGRPNVGKSTLLNKLLGENRALVSDVPGTTRDSIDSLLKISEERQYVLIDTAGLRKRAKIKLNLERWAGSMTMHSVERADVCLLVVDASEGPSDQDVRIARIVEEHGKGLIILLNKWDIVEIETRRQIMEKTREAFSFVSWAPILNMSALTGKRVNRVPATIDQVAAERRYRIGTSSLNRLVSSIQAAHHPSAFRNRPVKLLFATQVATEPPAIVVFTNQPEGITPQYNRYFASRLREEYPFTGSPLRIFWRQRVDNNPQ